MKNYTVVSDSLVYLRCCEEVQSGLITHDALGSIPKHSKARMAKLVDAYDLKSYPKGCWFKSSYEQMNNFEIFFLRKTRIFNKARYSRNRQLARVIFYFSLYINIVIIYYVFNVLYGLSFIFSWFWWLYFYLIFCFIWGVYSRILKR